MIQYYLCFGKSPYSKSVWDEERQDIDCLTQEVQSFKWIDYLKCPTYADMNFAKYTVCL